MRESLLPAAPSLIYNKKNIHMTTDLTIILNTHMPYVLGERELFCEPENWLFEAITETYIPLFLTLSRWAPERFEGKKIVISMTPCIVDQLLNCRERYVKYLEIMQKIAYFEVERSQNISLYNKFQKNKETLSEEQLALINASSRAYVDRIEQAIEFMSNHELLAFLTQLIDNKLSHVELWTSAPNHNFLPFFDKSTNRHFARRGVALFEKAFNRSPDGFWLPECAYMPGIEDCLINAGINQTALAINALEAYQPDLKSGVYDYQDLKLLIHDFRLAMHIWQSPADTLPSNPVYREFYRDVGLDVRPDYFEHLGISLSKQQQDKGIVWTGIKHYAGSGSHIPLGEKSIYDAEAASKQARLDAPKFLDILNQDRHLVHDRKTFIMAFDTELFGHWWHEGVEWLDALLQYDFSKLNGA